MLTKEALWERIDSLKEKYIGFLQEICNVETPSLDKAALDELADLIEAFARREGFRVERIPMERCGDFLQIDLNEGKEKKTFFMAHMDTVHDRGSFGTSPSRIEGDHLIAPGAIDCKGGIALALWVMQVLKEAGYPHHIRLLLTSDEEISNSLGGQEEIERIKTACTGFAAVLNCEVAEGQNAILSCNGILRGEFSVSGKSAHSGMAYFEGASAIREAAYKILAMEQRSREGGTTYSCANIKGGSKQLNIIPDACSFQVDVRVKSLEAAKEAEVFLRALAENVYVPGTHTELSLISSRLPMVENEKTKWLFGKLNEVCGTYGLDPFTKAYSGGGSDAAYTQLADVPTLCGMGAVGDFCHTHREYADLSRLAERAKVLTAMSLEL